VEEANPKLEYFTVFVIPGYSLAYHVVLKGYGAVSII